MKKVFGKDLKIIILLLFLFFPFFLLNAHSQVINGKLGTPVTFDTRASITTNIVSNDYLTLIYNLNSSSKAGWTVLIKANSDFSNGFATIHVGFISLIYSASKGGPGSTSDSGYQTLSTTNQKSMIVSTKDITNKNNDFQQSFNMMVSGGAHLGVAAGVYSTTLTVTLLSSTGEVMASNSNILVQFVVNYSSTCLTAVINSYESAQANFTSYTEQIAGKVVSDALSVQYNPNTANCGGWSLKVRMIRNFTNGATTLSPQNFSLRFNRVSTGIPTAAQIGVSTTTLYPLENFDVTLIRESNASFSPYTLTEHKFDLEIKGGTHLIIPNGVYKGTLMFSLYNSNNILVSSSNVDVAFNMNSVYNSLTLELQNLANEINLEFNTLANYLNGVSVTKAKGLRVVGYQPYQVMVKTSGLNLVSSNNTIIPVSAVNIQATKFTPSTVGITSFTRELSTDNQVIVTNPMVDNTQQIIEYDLKYFTTPGDNRLISKSGVYNTTVLFVVVSQ